ncbi:MAG: hypothetical protein GWN86_07545, partial [Desulfobacterales bacterium]|nr:hypothetical protein [Desulfobacterales bacterium]
TMNPEAPANRLVELGLTTQKELGRRVGIARPHMRHTWCTVFSLWAALVAEGADVESNPIDFYVRHTKITFRKEGKTYHRISASSGHVWGADLITGEYTNAEGPMEWHNPRQTLQGDTDARYQALSTFLKTTERLGVSVRISSEHSIALIRKSKTTPWYVWDTAGRPTHGTVFDPEGESWR